MSEERWRKLLESITAADRSAYGPGVLLARVAWEILEELGKTRRELRSLRGQLTDGLNDNERPTIGSDLGKLASVADPLLEALEAVSTEIARLGDTLDRARVDVKS